MTVDVRIADGVAVLTIRRPQRRNAIDLPTAQALECAVDAIDEDDDVVVSVLAGEGAIFCAGADLVAFNETGYLPVTAGRGGFGLLNQPSAKPMIAAVQGAAMGGGFELALACDLIVAAEDAKFGLPEVTYGLLPTGGGLLRLPTRVPRSLAYQMILTGQPISARKADAVGLTASLVPADDVLTEARRIASVIAANAPLSIGVAKRVLDESPEWSRADAFALQDALTDPVMQSADAAEGARAFSEKRRPRWLGR